MDLGLLGLRCQRGDERHSLGDSFGGEVDMKELDENIEI